MERGIATAEDVDDLAAGSEPLQTCEAARAFTLVTGRAATGDPRDDVGTTYSGPEDLITGRKGCRAKPSCTHDAVVRRSHDEVGAREPPRDFERDLEHP
jgi:hypothetical protein